MFLDKTGISAHASSRAAVEAYKRAANTDAVAMANSGIAAKVTHHTVFAHLAITDHLRHLNEQWLARAGKRGKTHA